MVPDSVSKPAPDFVSVPVPVAIAPETVVAPSPSKATLTFDPLTPPDRVSVPASDWISTALDAVRRPEMVLAPLTLRITPVDAVPVPAMDIASVSVIDPVTCSSAPEEIVVEPPEVPSEPEFDADRMPAEIEVGPV